MNPSDGAGDHAMTLALSVEVTDGGGSAESVQANAKFEMRATQLSDAKSLDSTFAPK